MLKTTMLSFVIFYILLFVIIGLVLTEIPLKIVRLLIDKQYGKDELTVKIVEDNDEGTNLLNEVKRLQKTMEKHGRFATWPRLINFFDDWFAENTNGKAVFLPNTIWYRRRQSNAVNQQGRQLLIFVHGGGMIAGSPLKYNSLNWITTVAWLGGRHNRYTDLLSLDYRLSPEHEAPDALADCLRQMHEVFLQINASSDTDMAQLKRVHLIGFSAGALLALQITLTLEYARIHPLKSKIFDIAIDNQLKHLADTMYDKTLTFNLYLCSPIVRLDRLFLNGHTDISATLRTFTTIFTCRAEQQDPLYVMQRHRLCLDCPAKIWLIDVSRNSLSNHSIQLATYLQAIDHRCFSTMIFTKEWFKVGSELLHKIKTFDMQRGVKTHKFLQNLQMDNEDNNRRINPMYYHFFMFIVPTQVAWMTVKLILGVLRE